MRRCRSDRVVLQASVTAAALLWCGAASAQLESHFERYEAEVVVGGVTALASERFYVVQPGDTLWDLSDAFYFDSLMWPTLWALNPHITNPHWIYPGDVLFIQAQRAAGETTAYEWSASRHSQQPRNLTLKTRTKGFIATEDYQESGAIEYAREPKEMLGTYDEVYIDFKTVRSPRAGDEYTLYRVEEPVRHPNSDEEIGNLVRFLGTVRLLDTSKPMVRGVVLKAYEEIYRGDLVTGIFQQQQVTTPAPNSVELDAIVLGAFEEGTQFGEHHYVFVDKGRNQGVNPGNRFLLRERGDPYILIHRDKELERSLDDFPWETFGEVMVVESYDDHCLGVVTSSIHELEAGQVLHMPRNY